MAVECVENLLRVLKDASYFIKLGVDQQDLMVRMTRKVGLLGYLDVKLTEAGVWSKLSFKVQKHLEAARVVAEEDDRMLRWEVNRIQRAFYGTGLPVIVLKGAAYTLMDLPLSRGRLVADVDLLVNRSDLTLVENQLIQHGWQQVKLDPYDQRYYRQWMHELPPMRHKERMTEVDVHHTLLPLSGGLSPDPEKLLKDVILLPNEANIYTLSPVDMTLHAVVHLFHDSDFERGLRGVVDLDGLFRYFSQEEGYWDTLFLRAKEFGLNRPLYYALIQVHGLLATPLPKTVMTELKLIKPPFPIRWLMNRLIPWAVLPGNPEDRRLISLIAWWLLYVRSHWLRMPPGQLFNHLTRKLSRRWYPDVRNRRTV